MPSRKFDTGLWNKPWFENFTANEKLIYIWLGKNDSCPACGIYTITIKRIAAAVDLPNSQVEKAIRSMEPHIMYDWRINLVFYRRFVEEQRNSDSWLKAVEKSINQLKPHPFVKEFLQENKRFRVAYRQPLDRLFTAPDTDTDSDFDLKEGGMGGEGQLELETPPKVSEPQIPYEEAFDSFWFMYPAKNGKKLGKADTMVEFEKLTLAEVSLVLTAVKNYAASERVKNGAIRDPVRFFRYRGEKEPHWKEWMEPEKGGAYAGKGPRIKPPGYD